VLPPFGVSRRCESGCLKKEFIMAKKKVTAIVKIQIPAGAASPAPPVGTALGPHGVAIMDFCKEYNARTEAMRGTVVPVEISIYEDRTFSFVTKTPPAPVLIREAAGLAKGSTEPGRGSVGQISDEQLTAIATTKLPDLNTNDLEAAKLQIAGTARSMGVLVID
jgi:large subunit ribosomal protein L11